MMNRKAVITGAILVAVIIALIAGRGWISSWSFRQAAGNLYSHLPPDLRTKYEKDIGYTLDKFWKCYAEGICSRNDMTDVMDRMKQLAGDSQVKDLDVFEFIDFVSRLYTDRLDVYHRETIEKMEEERRGQPDM